ncbi:unnamed protein product, partial [Ilex paraguariensis]
IPSSGLPKVFGPSMSNSKSIRPLFSPPKMNKQDIILNEGSWLNGAKKSLNRHEGSVSEVQKVGDHEVINALVTEKVDVSKDPIQPPLFCQDSTQVLKELQRLNTREKTKGSDTDDDGG